MITIKSDEEIEKIRECGKISASFFRYIESKIKPGITTKEIDRLAEEFIYDNGAFPSFKGYSGFPASICASVNEEVIHGIPCNRVLKDGDIVGIDIGIKKFGMISDSAKTFTVGTVSEQTVKLLNRTHISLYKGISAVSAGKPVNDIGAIIESYINQFGYGIVREYCGHGVGYENHEEPEVLNYKTNRTKKLLKKGMVIAIEPMINMGKKEVFVTDDGWTVSTKDRKYSAHFEHTVAVTDKGFDILTVDEQELNEFKSVLNNKN